MLAYRPGRRVEWQKNGSLFSGPLTQRRAGTYISAAGEPYINHLTEVAILVAEATDGKDPELVIAALLHDAIEDQEVLRSVIAQAFGPGVAGLVDEVTDDKKLESKSESVCR